jgi:hypothetical protein
MQVKLKNGEIDVCIGAWARGGETGGGGGHDRGTCADLLALTDALIAGLANGQDAYKLVGRYIASPLRWSVPNHLALTHKCRAIITGKDSKYTEVDQLAGTTFGISRLGSGSQVMASVLSLQQKWAQQPQFKGVFMACQVTNAQTEIQSRASSSPSATRSTRARVSCKVVPRPANPQPPPSSGSGSPPNPSSTAARCASLAACSVSFKTVPASTVH